MNLPTDFTEQMKTLLKDEFQDYIDSFDTKPHSGLRVNERKIQAKEFMKKTGWNLRPVPWISNGFYQEEENPAKDPYYYGGLYYLQEPSAMTPADRLAPEPGDYVLDLCAAPGGKATELGARLQGQGLLVANDISNSRAKALLKNLELMGIPNIYVTSENPEKLQKMFPEFFDKILVDAPCSGEGMFRKDPKMVSFWEEQGPEYYSRIQRELVLQAADMLRPGGKMLYSTCTFSTLENEGTIEYLLRERPQMHLVPCKGYDGFSSGKQGLSDCVRIFPHKMEGEGHFLALLEKEGDLVPRKKEKKKPVKLPLEAEEFLKVCKKKENNSPVTYRIQEERIYAVGAMDGMPEKLRYLRTGLFLGTCKKKRFEPSQALAMALNQESYPYCISFSHEDERVIRYLKGETIDISDRNIQKGNGWQLVCVEEFPLGWGKLAGNTLKNKYYAGWRWQ